MMATRNRPAGSESRVDRAGRSIAPLDLRSALVGLLMIAVGGLSIGPAPAVAQLNDGLPKALQEVGVDEHLDEVLPDLAFTDDQGRPVQLRDYFGRGKPVILSFNYSNCPMLCSLQLTGLFTTLKQVELTAGQDFELVSVSIDPKETTDKARATKAKYVEFYERDPSGRGIHFLTGDDATIRRLAKAAGVRYKYVEERKEYAHTAVFLIITPERHIARYVYGIEYLPQTLRLSLVEAADGRIGTTTDRIMLYCFHYDPEGGRYTFAAIAIMRVGGALMVAALGIWLIPRWLRDWLSPPAPVDAPAGPSPPPG